MPWCLSVNALCTPDCRAPPHLLPFPTSFQITFSAHNRLSGFCSLVHGEGGLPSWIECYMKCIYSLWSLMKCISNRMYWCFTCYMGLKAKGSKEDSLWAGWCKGNMAAQQRLYHVYRVQRVVCPCLMLWCSTRTVITFITNLCLIFMILNLKKKWCLCS